MNIYIIGAGAAGMICAITAAELGANVYLIEKNEKTGKKIYVTGKGRCNLTNCTDFNGFTAYFKLVSHAFYKSICCHNTLGGI